MRGLKGVAIALVIGAAAFTALFEAAAVYSAGGIPSVSSTNKAEQQLKVQVDLLGSSTRLAN